MDLFNQLQFNFLGKRWPSQEDFPINLPDRNVEDVLLGDISNSNEFLIITGFTSLEYLINLYDKLPELTNKKVRFTLGFEPQVREREKWPVKDYSDTIKDYWLDQGISPLLSGTVINLIEQIKSGQIEFRFSNRIHAKIYVGITHAILGSSNFSKSGLDQQREANIRVSNINSEKQYSEIKLIAENYFDESSPYTRIIELLSKLLINVDWPEALCRAIAELLEGNWIKRYPEAFRYLDIIQLWPSQRAAIAQALHILDNHGSALIADPTGSGKTRLVSSIQLALISRLWQTGKGDKTFSQLICPPIVSANWKSEHDNLKFPHPSPMSSGILSFAGTTNHAKALSNIKNANILVVDEAHNYLNRKSLRSISLSNSLADSVILVTATPINKKAEDLLRLVEMLDIDNLDDEELQQFKILRKAKRIKSREQSEQLRQYINKFTVRRTKKQLNELIKKEPEKYLNREGKQCKYPQHICKTYRTGETDEDKALATRIDEAIGKLKGILNLRRLLINPEYPKDHQEQRVEIEKRLTIAKALTKYQIQAKLRSSRAALIEHIEGTVAATKYFDFDKPNKKETGNILKTLEEFILSNQKPKSDYVDSVLPLFLRDKREYLKECQNEINIYKEIATLTKSISDGREKSKVRQILKLINKYPLLVAFDSSVITLTYLKHLLSTENGTFKAHIVTGKEKRAKQEVIRIFGLGSKEKGHIALCSDSMSEGVNLQQGSAVVLLDMPTVLRIAEQRIGRLDRMDSPHEKIVAYWPNDSREFALKTDRKLISVSYVADFLIGSNLELPPDLIDKLSDETITADDFIKEYKQIQKTTDNWDGIFDAFQPIRNLVEGERALIPSQTYAYYKGVRADVRCKVSILQSKNSFGFFAFKGTQSRSPKWVLVDSNQVVTKDLMTIANKLSTWLPECQKSKWDSDAKIQLRRFLGIIEQEEINLLPNKKRRALNLLIRLLNLYKKSKSADSHRSSVINALLDNLEPDVMQEHTIDYYLWMEAWLEFIQPDLAEIRRKSPPSRPKDISDLFKIYKQTPVTTEILEKLLSKIPFEDKPERKIVSCIIGVSHTIPSAPQQVSM